MRDGVTPADRETVRRGPWPGPALWAAFFLGVALLNWPVRHQPYWWDALGYVLPHAREILVSGFVPILREWDVGHPTGYFFLLAVFLKVWGVGPLAGHLLSWCFAALGLAAVTLVGRRLGLPRSVAAGGAVLLWSFPLFFAASRQVTPDLALAALCWSALLAWARERPGPYVLAGGLAVLVKFHGFLLVPAVALAALLARGRFWRPERRAGLGRELAWVGAPLASLGLFLLVRLLVRGPGWTIGWEPRQTLRPVWDWPAFAGNWDPVTTNLWEVSRLGGPLAAAALLGGLALALARVRRRDERGADGEDGPARRLLVGLVVFVLVYQAALLQTSAVLARFALPVAGAIFPLLSLALWRLTGRIAPVVAVQLLLILLHAGLCRPDRLADLPGPLARLRPGPALTGHHLEADLRYEDYVQLIAWAGRRLGEDAAATGAGPVRVAARWPASRALADPDLGYVAAPYAVTEIRGWDAVDADSASHVVVLEGIGRMRPIPPEGVFRSRLVASRRQGEGSAHVWRVAPREDRGAE